MQLDLLPESRLDDKAIMATPASTSADGSFMDTTPRRARPFLDRVVQLSNGDYEVHNIGVNWPHHVFVNKNFKVIGAD